MSENCLICGQQGLKKGTPPYHQNCSKKMFGIRIPPIIPYTMADMKQLASEIISQKTTMTGVQKKLSLTIRTEGQENKLTFVGLWGDYILKPQVSAYPQLPENEFLTLCLAELFGIRTVPHALLRLKSGEWAYVTRRIDRSDEGKIHMEDMAQILDRMTEDKYRGSAEQIGKKILEHCENRIFDALRFYELILFSYLCGNGDMHLKNFSLIYTARGIELAPAYDLLNTRLVISEKDDPDESALSINGKRRKLKREDFTALAGNLQLIDRQIENVHARFNKKKETALQMISDSLLDHNLKKDYRKILKHRFSIIS